MAQQISTASTEYVRVQVTATLNGQPYNPTSDSVYMAFKAAGATPGVSDWATGTWETANGAYYALGLVGPSNNGTVLAAGTYTVWVKVTDNPEIPVRAAGTVVIF